MRKKAGTVLGILWWGWVGCGPSSGDAAIAVPPLAVSAPSTGPASSGQDPRWAAPLSEPGLPNLHRVAPALYRSAQPEEAGFRAAQALGVKTVVNLRSLHSDRDLLAGTTLGYEHLPMVAWEADEDALVAFLRIATDPAKQPVLVHCQHGADRTGTAIALYRMVVEGWSRTDAIREMTEGGFGFHPEWHNLIEFLEQVDVERLRTRLAAK